LLADRGVMKAMSGEAGGAGVLRIATAFARCTPPDPLLTLSISPAERAAFDKNERDLRLALWDSGHAGRLFLPPAWAGEEKVAALLPVARLPTYAKLNVRVDELRREVPPRLDGREAQHQRLRAEIRPRYEYACVGVRLCTAASPP
jgi:hypothetical protein